MRALLAIATVLVPLVAGCVGEADDGRFQCDTYSESFELQGDRPPSMYLRVESCRVDVGACLALCQAVLDDREREAQALACDVEFQGDEVHLSIDYTDCPPPPSESDVVVDNHAGSGN